MQYMNDVNWDIFLETFQANFKFPVSLAQTIILGLAVILFVIFMLNIVLKLQSNDSQKRATAYKAIIPLVLGFFIMAGSVAISGALKATSESLKYSQSVPGGTEGEEIPNYQVQDEGNFIIESMGKGITSFADSILDFAENTLGMKSFDELFYAQEVGEGGERTTNAIAPFTESEWNAIETVYRGFFIVATSIFFIMVAMTGYRIMSGASKMNPREDAYQDLERWFFVLMVIALGPVAIRVMLEILNSMSGSLYNITETLRPDSLDYTFNEITTGNFLLTGVLKLYFAYVFLKINVLFIVRKIMLTLLIPLMPIYAVIMGIKKDTDGFDIYLGEVISNLLTGFVYSLVFMLITILTNFGTSKGGIIFDYIVLTVAFEIAKVIRNSFQNIFTRAGGVDEERMASGITKTGTAFARKAALVTAGALLGRKKLSASPTGAKVESAYSGPNGGRIGSGSQGRIEDVQGNRMDPFSASANPQDTFDDMHSKTYGENDGLGAHAVSGEALQNNAQRFMMQGARDDAYNQNFTGRYQENIANSKLAQKGGLVGGLARVAASKRAHSDAVKDVQNKLAEEKYGVPYNKLLDNQKASVKKSFDVLRSGTYKIKTATNGLERSPNMQNTANGVIEKTTTRGAVIKDNINMVTKAFTGNTRGMQRDLDKHHIGYHLDSEVGRGTYNQVQTDYMSKQKKDQREYDDNKREEKRALARERQERIRDELVRSAEDNYDPGYEPSL